MHYTKDVNIHDILTLSGRFRPETVQNQGAPIYTMIYIRFCVTFPHDIFST